MLLDDPPAPIVDEFSDFSDDNTGAGEGSSNQGLACGIKGCPQKNTVWKTQARLDQHRLELIKISRKTFCSAP